MKSALDKRDDDLLSELCDRNGVAAVLEALAERCAYEAFGRTDAQKWQDAYRAIRQAIDALKR
jgi:hypothetical protein